MKHLRNSGFTIIEVIVDGLFLLGLAFAFFQFLNGAMKGQKNVQNAVDFDILKTSLNLVLNTKACDGALLANSNPVVLSFPSILTPGTNLIVPPATVNIDEIKQGNSTIATRNGSLNGGMTLTTLAITDAIYDGDQNLLDSTNTLTTYRSFVSTIKVEATKASGSAGIQKLSTLLSVRLLARASGANQGRIEKCSSSAGFPSGAWCGLAFMQSIPAATPVLFSGGAAIPQGASLNPVSCQGLNPATACPAGFTQFTFTMISWNSGTNQAAAINTCVRN